MTALASLEEFASQIASMELSHVDSAVAILWYLDAKDPSSEASASELTRMMKQLALANANVTRLEAGLKKHWAVMKGAAAGRFKLRLAAKPKLAKEYGARIASDTAEAAAPEGKSKLIEAKPSPATVAPPKAMKARVFIGSSVEGLAVAEAIQLGLDHTAECTVWTQGVFGLTANTLDELLALSKRVDYAVLVLTADDVTTKRNATSRTARDNVIFELGLFLGALGMGRAAMVYCRDEKPELPTDLAGITPATYAKRSDGNMQAALGTVCTLLKKELATL